MSFVWEDYLNLAEKLLAIAENKIAYPELDNQEALLRSAISRAYYSAYHYALDYLLDNTDFQMTKYDSHVTVIIADRNSIYRDRKAIAPLLSYLKDARIRADYFLTFVDVSQRRSVSLEVATPRAVAEARTVINMINNFKPRSNRII
jgi:uncharacterized protein (UPF0332 family)